MGLKPTSAAVEQRVDDASRSTSNDSNASRRCQLVVQTLSAAVHLCVKVSHALSVVAHEGIAWVNMKHWTLGVTG